MHGAAQQRVLSYVRAHSPDLVRADSRAWALGGANVNATSFRVDTHHVRVVQGRPKPGTATFLAELTSALCRHGLPVVPPTHDRAGRLVTWLPRQNVHVAIHPFIEGRFFSGSAQDLRAALPLLRGLGSAVRSVRPRSRGRYADWHPVRTLERTRRELTDRRLAGSLDGFDRAVLSEIDLLDEIVRVDLDHLRAPHRLQHIDLHPHNLLYAGGKLAAILDIDSFEPMPAESAIGFALFKLGRKGVSLGRLTPRGFRGMAAAEFDLDELLPFARLEIARRATAVIEGHYFGDPKWDRDLRKQLAGLREVVALFRGCPPSPAAIRGDRRLA